MQLLILTGGAWLPKVMTNGLRVAGFADRGYADRGYKVTVRPKRTTPLFLFKVRPPCKDLAGGETFNHGDNFGRTVVRHRL